MAWKVPKGHVEGEGVNRVLMSLEFVQQIARLGVPYLTGPVVAARNEST